MSASSKELAQMGVPPAQPQGAASVIDFGPSATETKRGSDSADTTFDLEKVLTNVRETAYRWDFPSDRIDWAANAEAVLGVAQSDKISKGRAFALLVDPEQAGPRYDGITGGPHVAPETEVRYCLHYPLPARGAPRTRRALGRGHRRLPHQRGGGGRVSRKARSG